MVVSDLFVHLCIYLFWSMFTLFFYHFIELFAYGANSCAGIVLLEVNRDYQ